MQHFRDNWANYGVVIFAVAIAALIFLSAIPS